MKTAVLFYVNEGVTSEVKKRGLSIRMTEMENPPSLRRITEWFKGAIKEYEETSLLVDYEGPHDVTYTHSSLVGLPDWLPKLEAQSGTSLLHHLKKLQELNAESALFLLYRKMRTLSLKDIVPSVTGASLPIRDAVYHGKVIKLGGTIQLPPAVKDGLVLTDGTRSAVINDFPPEMITQCAGLLNGKQGIVVGIVKSVPSDAPARVRCAGLFVID